MTRDYHTGYKVKDLIKKLEKADPDAVVVVSSFDHSFRRVTGWPDEAVESGYDLGEHHEELELLEGQRVIKVFVIG